MSIGGGSWFVTLEMPEKTALLVRADKDKKYITELYKLPSGNYVIRYRGLTENEKSDRKAQAVARKK